jgi:hypothetical protein
MPQDSPDGSTDDASTDASSTDDQATNLAGSMEPATHASATWKVLGQLDDPTGVGVLGHNTATSGTGYGVEGVTDSPDRGAAGVHGHAAALSPDPTFGVVGTTASDDNLAAGVYGDGDQALGVRGISSGDDGVFGLSYASGSAGVYGENKEPSGSSTNGVRGIARSGADGTAGVKGQSFATSGATYGVFGSASSPDGYGLYSADDARVEGSVSMGAVGTEVVRTTDLSVPGSTTVTVAYDTVRTDDLNEYDTGTGTWTATNAGDYLVTAQVEWGQSNMSAGEGLNLYIYRNGSTFATNYRQSAGSNGPSMNVSKTVRGLGAGDTISVRVSHYNASGMEISGSAQYNWLEISRIG